MTAANPFTIVLVAVTALTVGIIWAWSKFEGFRKVVLGTWEVLKGFGNIIKEFVIDRIKGMLTGVGSIGQAIAKLFEGDFSGAWESAKSGVADLGGYTALKNAYNSTTQTDWGGLYNQGAANAVSRKGKENAISTGASIGGTIKTVTSPTAAFQQTGSFSGEQKQVSGTTKGKTSGKASKDGVSLSGSGSSGGGKTIIMTVNNYISGFKGTNELAQEVARKINGRLSDGLAVVG